MFDRQVLIQSFTTAAKRVSAVVVQVTDMEDAVDYALNLFGSRRANRINVSGSDNDLSQNAEELCLAKEKKIIAAPGLKPDHFELLSSKCGENGFVCLSHGMRNELAGVDIGFTYGDYGLAETGTVVLNCPDEELRLATMLCECHVCVLAKSNIVDDAFAGLEHLMSMINVTPDYTAFITGPSRTADIERVLTIGVHGPLELHILLLED